MDSRAALASTGMPRTSGHQSHLRQSDIMAQSPSANKLKGLRVLVGDMQGTSGRTALRADAVKEKGGSVLAASDVGTLTNSIADAVRGRAIVLLDPAFFPNQPILDRILQAAQAKGINVFVNGPTSLKLGQAKVLPAKESVVAKLESLLK